MPGHQPDRDPVPPPVDARGTRSALVVILLFLLAAVVAVGGATVYFRGEAAEIYGDAERQVQLTSDITLRQLVQWRRERIGDAQVLFERNSHSPAILNSLRSGDATSMRNVRAWLGSYLSSYGDYDRVFLLSPTGSVALAAPNADEAPAATLIAAAADAMTRRGPAFVDFYRDEQDGLPHMAIVVPVVDGDPEGTVLGSMILRIDPRAFVYAAVRVEPGNGSTGEMALLRRDGDSLLVLNPLRFEPDSALTLRIPTSTPGGIEGMAAAGTVGAVQGIDHRGRRALAYVALVGDSPWLLVTLIEVDELQAGLSRHLWLVTSGVVLLLLSVGAALVLWRRDQRLLGYQRQAQLATALQASEERLRLALASASQGLYDLDLQSGAAIVSPEYARMLGHDPATFTESLEGWRSRVHPDDRMVAFQALDQYVHGQASTYHVEFRLATQSGGWKWVMSVGQVVERDALGAPKRMIGTHTDITQLKWAQDAQARVATQLRNLLANSPTVVYSIQAIAGQLRLVAISENVERVIGYSPTEVMQPDFWQAHVHPDDRGSALPGPLGPRDEATHTYRFRAKDGEYRWIQDHVTVLRRGPQGIPSELAGAWSDVTAQHEAEQAVRTSEERLRLAMISARQGLWDLDLVTREAVTSPEYASMLGFDPVSFRETADDWNARVHPDDFEACDRAFREYVEGRLPEYDVECRQRTADGRWLWIHSIGRIIERAPDGAPVRMLGIHTDIEARKAAELDAERLSRLYMTRSACNAAIVRCTSREELFPQICQALVEAGGFDMAWIGLVDPDTLNVHVVARHGEGLGYLDSVAVSVDPASPRSNGPTGTAIKTNRPAWVDDFAVNPLTTPWHADAVRYGWVAAAAFPLRESRQVVGALTIYLRSLGNFGDDVKDLLTKMSDDISFALDAFHRNTLRLEAETRMRQSESRYRSLFAESTVPMVVIDPAAGLLVDANDAAAAFYGWRQSEMRGMPVSNFATMSPGDAMTLIDQARGGQGFFETQHRIASGELRDIVAYPARVQIEDRACVMATIIDVTARRQAERRAEQLSRLYVTLTRSNEAIVRSSSATELFPRICQAAVESGGFSMAWAGVVDLKLGTMRVVAADGAGADFLRTLNVSLDPRGPYAQGPVAAALRNGQPYWVENFQTAPGTEHIRPTAARFGWISGAIIPLLRGTAVAGVFVVAAEFEGGFDEASRSLLVDMGADLSFALEVYAGQDQRNQAEMRLRQSEARYRTLFADSGVPMLLIDPATHRVSDANAAAASFYGWDVSALRRMRIDDINTLDEEALAESVRLAARLARGRFSFTHRLASGDLRDVDVFTARVIVEDQPRIFSIVIDVTAQRLAEAALRNQEHMLVEAQRLAHIGSWTFGNSGRMTWSDEMYRLFDLPPGSPVPPMEEFARLVHPDDLPLVQQTMAANLSGTLTPDIEYRVMRTDGSVRYLSARGELRSDPVLGEYLAGTVQDVTDRRLADEALRFRDRAIESAQSAIAIGDLDGNVTFVNRAFLDMWQLSDADEVIGRSIVPFWAEPQKAIEVITELNATGRPWTGELTAVTATGRRLDILVSAARVTDERQQPVGLVGAFIDITERKHTEQAMAASIEEKEALLKEVHHRVKNNLQVISSLLRLELGRTKDGGVRAVLGEMQNRVVSMALLHETLYRSDNLARVDLSSYLERLVNQLFRSSAPSSGRVSLQTNIEQTFVDLEQAVPCGLLVTELVSNSLKHAFTDGRAGEVRVTLHHVEGGPALVLTVSDSGPGLPDDFDVRRTQSLGLQLVSDLARQLRGTLTIASESGASFSLAFTPRAATLPSHG